MKNLLIILSILLSFLGCSRPTNVVNLRLKSKLTSIDPAKAFDKSSLEVLGSVYEPLYQYHYLLRPHKVIPLLAIGQPEVSSDGLIYKIKIKKGIRYHDHPAFEGKIRYVVAEDFITQLKRLAFGPLKSPGYALLRGLVKGFDRYSKEVGNNILNLAKVPFEGAKALDEHTLELRLEKKVSNLVHLLTLSFFAPVPIEVLGKIDFEKSSLGTGPFILHSTKNNVYHLKRNKGYRKELYPSVGDREAHASNLLNDAHKSIPFLDDVYYRIIESDDEAWEAFKNKNIDYMEVPKTRMDEIIDYKGEIKEEYAKKDIELKIYPSMINRWLSFNFSDPLMGKNKNIREAISLAIDRNLYNIEIKQSTALVANSIFTPGIEGYDTNRRFDNKIDIKRAKSLLKESGFDQSNPLKIKYSTRTKGRDGVEEASFLKKSLQQIGIDLEIEYLEFSEFLKKGRNGELQFFTDNWIYDYPDPLNMLQLLHSKNHPGINKSAFSSKKFDKLYEKLEQTNDPGSRRSLFNKLENEVITNVAWIMLCYERDVMVTHKRVRNLRKSSFIRNYIKYIRMH
jgi:oligopeptide transport system substrate-binding protein